MRKKSSRQLFVIMISVVFILGLVITVEVVAGKKGSLQIENSSASQGYPAFLSPVLRLFASSPSFGVYSAPVLKNYMPGIAPDTTETSTATATQTNTATSTSTPTNTATMTSTSTATATATSTHTPTATSTSTVTPTQTANPYPYPAP